MKLFNNECPCCDGNGEFVEPVLDYGIGPLYPCAFCRGKGTVSFLKVLQWKRMENWEERSK